MRRTGLSAKSSSRSPLSTVTTESHTNDNGDSNKENQQKGSNITPVQPITRKRRLFARLSLDGINNLQNSQQLESLAIATCFAKRTSLEENSSFQSDHNESSIDGDHYTAACDWFGMIRSCFHRSFAPSSSSIMATRSKEREIFESFWSKNVSEHDCDQTSRNACLFVTGPPGCGKSAFVHDFISRKSVYRLFAKGRRKGLRSSPSIACPSPMQDDFINNFLTCFKYQHTIPCFHIARFWPELCPLSIPKCIIYYAIFL